MFTGESTRLAGRRKEHAIRAALAALALGALAAGCAVSRAAELLPALSSGAVHDATLTPPATSSPTAANTPTVTPTGGPEPTATPPAKALLSEVLGEAQQAQAPPPPSVRGGTHLPLADGVSVVWGGCASDGECHPYNFYWAPTHEAVMQNGEPPYKVQHELCHAHQHWSINGGAPLTPSDYDLESWYATGEGQSFVAAVAGLAWPWSHSAVNALEDFAWTCAYWYLDPAYLLRISPQRYGWAEANLP